MTLINYLTRIHFADDVLEEALWSELCSESISGLMIISTAQDLESVNGDRLLSGIPVRTKDHVYSRINSVAHEKDAHEIADIFLDKGFDLLLAFGSAEAIDLAKIARVAIAHRNPLSKFTLSRGGSRLISSQPLPDLFAIPTISGLGSAVSAEAPLVLQNGERAMLRCKKLIPTVTICDPTLTLGVNKVDTASAGVDSIAHCIEAYISKSFNPPADGLALDGLSRAVRNLKKVLADENDIIARREMMAASLNGGLALQKGLGASQAISNALDAVGDHKANAGLINKIVLPSVLQFNQEIANCKLEALRSVFEISAHNSVAAGVQAFFNTIPLPSSLSQLGFSLGDIEKAAPLAERDFCSETNPRQIKQSDYLSIMQAVF